MSEPSARAEWWGGRGAMWLAIVVVAALAAIAIVLANDDGPATAADPAGQQTMPVGYQGGPEDAARSTIAPAEQAHVIQVTGTAQFEVAPDRAIFTAGVERDADTAEAARTQVSDVLGRLIPALRNAGVPENRLQSNGLQVNPRYSDDGDTIVGFRASADVNVTIDDLAKVGTVIDAAGSAGANNIGSVTFTLQDPSAVQRDTLARAAQDGRAQAEAVARGAGVEVGALVSITALGDTPLPYPAAERAADAAASPVPVAVGVLEGRVSVSMSFAIG